MEKQVTASLNMDKQEACFAHATPVWHAVNHSTSITSDK